MAGTISDEDIEITDLTGFGDRVVIYLRQFEKFIHGEFTDMIRLDAYGLKLAMVNDDPDEVTLRANDIHNKFGAAKRQLSIIQGVMAELCGEVMKIKARSAKQPNGAKS